MEQNPYETPTHSGIDSEFPLEIILRKMWDVIHIIPELACVLIALIILVIFLPLFTIAGIISEAMSTRNSLLGWLLILWFCLVTNYFWYENFFPLEIKIVRYLTNEWR